jgi:hypothetical protein
MPLCTEKLMIHFQVHVKDLKDPLRTLWFVERKKILRKSL